MAGSDKDRGTFGGVALALSFTAISISIVCLLQVFFLSGPNAQCSCPRNAREQPHSIPQDLRNATGKVKRARGPPKDIAAKKTRKETSKTVKQPLEEKHARKRRATQNKATQTNTNTAWGGYLHNAILRLQQQMIVVEGRTQYLQEQYTKKITQVPPRGPPGSPGIPGRDGSDGRPGMDGPMGHPGRDGPQGKDGHPGSPGSAGPPGVNGLPGLQGQKGFKGEKGEPGQKGDRGLTGLKGTRGVAGIPGENGEPGIPGRVGIKGDKGEAGETTCYVTEKGRRLEKPCLEASVYDDSAGTQNTGDTGGLTYIRWGRTACPVGDAKIIYSGQAAGTRHQKSRTGGSPFICVPNQPWYFGQVDASTPLANVTQVSSEVLAQDTTRSTLHGTYFYLSCVLCLVRKRSVQIMLPARKECYRGWHREYDGYLAVQTNWKDHKDLICVDRQSRGLLQDADYVRGLYASCETFSCPPYVESERLPCVVCTM
ncbi:unnamed protein product [Porites evermanni]|uniref:Uncharacterized protein n=1 Tax=Porites evermanni TaxID=104178 RepID=A0ABN8LHY9_9CNID|nr:unnamed protein product [Porites evermanni]